ncbi:MAG: alkaline phosphatase D family protein [Bryobacterales bacterium]|nr:alkaline phosphatase D family protein [Bryobacterales bacterium]
MDRRSFLALQSRLFALALVGTQFGGRLIANPRFSTNPYSLGVASGDPAADGFVIWTRLAPDPVKGGGMGTDPVKVRWEVAEDEAMRRVVQSGDAIASPELAHSVHVEVAGLQADRPYWYRFQAGDATSPVGRARTMPALGTMPGKLRFAFASCQDYHFHYTAWQHMAAETDIDLVFHLGDYIYEGGPKQNTPRQHNGPEIYSLDDYRNRLALYKTDEHLQAMHRHCPFLVTWDDHEVDNNYAGAMDQDGTRPETFLKRRALAYQAYYEHMPLRSFCRPVGPDMQLYRRMSYGSLADFFILDTRQYRSNQPCGDKSGKPCDGFFDPRATMLGESQERWLHDGLGRSSGRWNVLAQQVILAGFDTVRSEDGPTFSMDQWSGYYSARNRLTRFLSEAKPSNPVVLTGDVHSNWVSEVPLDFLDERSPSVAAEFVGTSITSGGDGTANTEYRAKVLAKNPWMRHYNGQRGYVSCTVTPERWLAEYRTVEYVSRPGSPIETHARFVVENGSPRITSA